VAIDPSVSCFRRADAPNGPTQVPLSAVVARIRSDELAERCAEIRRVFDEAGGGQTGKDAIRNLKKPLPGVTLSGTFDRRANSAWREPSGLVGIDLDDLDASSLTRAWDALAAAPWTALLFRSPSGSGIKGAVRVPDIDGTDRDAYAVAWHAVTLWLASLGFDNDPAVKDVSRLAFLAHDPDAFWNPEATVFDVARWTLWEPADPQPPMANHAGGLRPGDDFNTRADLPALLMHHGWKLERDGVNQHWCRPGKEDGTSATLRDGVFYVFTSSAAPFEANHAYRAFAIYALLEHGGDYAEAAGQLRKYGYGDQALVATTSVEDDEPDPPDPGPIPIELLCVPGFVGQVMDYCLATAPYPNPTLAFCGAMALQGTLAGRCARDEADNRTNLYLLGLANSGAGKDHPRKVNQRIMLEAGMPERIGDSFASGEGIEDRMLLTPCMLFQTDEMDALLVAIREGKDGRSERIMQALLKFYSSANAIYPMRVKAGKEPEFINQPCLSIFGTAIPQHFYESLSAKMLSNGFFARMLVLEAGRRGTGQTASTPPIPDDILATARWWQERSNGRPGMLAGINPDPVVVPATADARELLARVRRDAEQAYDAHEGNGDQMGMAIWARAAEKVHRLALCYACSERHEDPMVGAAAVEWAWQLTEHQTRRMIAMATRHVYEGEFDQRQKRVVEALRAQGGSLTQRRFNKVMRWLKPQERAEIVQNLLEAGMLEAVSEATGGRPRTVYRLMAMAISTGEGHKSDA